MRRSSARMVCVRPGMGSQVRARAPRTHDAVDTAGARRRASPRHELRVRVLVTFGAAQIEGWTRDIGPGGVSIEAGEPPPFGARVSVRLELPSASGPATLPGTVRWVTSTTFGVQFGLLRAFDTWALNQLLRGPRG